LLIGVHDLEARAQTYNPLSFDRRSLRQLGTGEQLAYDMDAHPYRLSLDVV
jgi:hypothetical protein